MKEIKALYETYYDDVYQWMYWKCGSSHTAMDLTQDTFLQVMNSLYRYQGLSSERTWIMSIGRHVWLDYVRKKKVEVEYDDGVQIEKEASSTYDMELLLSKLKQCNQKQYELVMYRLQGYSHAEIAENMNCSEASIRVLFHRVKKWMREEIERSEFDETSL